MSPSRSSVGNLEEGLESVLAGLEPHRHAPHCGLILEKLVVCPRLQAADTEPNLVLFVLL